MARNTAELDGIGYHLDYLRGTYGHIPEVAERIDIIMNCLTTLRYPHIPIGLGIDETQPNADEACQTALNTIAELSEFIAKKESH